MKALRLFILYRLPLGIVLLLGAIVFFVMKDWGMGIFLVILSLVCILSHFLLGTLRLVQEAMMEGNMDDAMKYLNMIKFPGMLIKPVRQGYYMLQSQLAMASQDFNTAESHIRKGMQAQTSYTKEYEGTSYFQLGMIAAQKMDKKEARSNLLKALELGVPDKDTEAMAYLQLAAIEIQMRRFPSGRNFFAKAKKCNPQNPEIKGQIATLEKQMSQLPRQ